LRVLVTGGAGFIGSTLVDRLLAEGCDVDAIDDLSSGALVNLGDARAQRSRRFSFHRLDVRSPQLVDLVVHRRPEVIFHLAAQLDVRRSVQRPIFDAEVNILGSLNVCEAAVAGGTRKVVFAGSGGTRYGVPESLPVRESHPQHPVSPYGVSKKAAGDYLHVYRELHGLEYTDLALANVYGPRQDPNGEAGVVAIFAAQLLAGRRPTIYGDGEQTRDFLFVDDAVDAFVRAAERGGGLLVNIGTGIETSVRELYARMASLTGMREEPAWAAGRAGELARSALDSGRAAIQLGWKPWTTLDEGLALTLDHFRAHSGL
jgi:UDP-glucose 4-epimerase